MRAEVEVLELHQLTADLVQHSAPGRARLDLREAIAAVLAADGLTVATPVLASSPSGEIDSLFVALGNTCLSGIPVPAHRPGRRRTRRAMSSHRQ
ncbi:hypothetical protein ABZT02_41025 [Streptomyces sp. NPDC005402]|uniref:hypothetical protein n=1 Tax=Streptomyces sp. NPDC005402 TaxID=3155338 RepID=UPI0033A095B7